MFWKTNENQLPQSIGTEEPIETAVIFVHGFLGDKFTWDIFSNHLANNWEKSDSFKFTYYEYYIPLNIKNHKLKYLLRFLIGSKKIEKLAKKLGNYIETVFKDKDYKYIIFVAHSMGGLVVRKYIIDHLIKVKKVEKTKALITYATPHHGSKFATIYYRIYPLIYIFDPFWRISSQIVQMRSKPSSFIKKLNSDWDSLEINKKIEFIRVVGKKDIIVNEKSASYEKDVPGLHIIENKDHFTIIQPTTNDDKAFLVCRDYLENFKSNMINLMLKEEEEEEIN